MRANEEISALVRALAGYLHANPLASDTCEGALTWWLGRQAGATAQQLQVAFDELVKLGLVERVTAADGKVRYRCSNTDAATLARLAELAREGNGDRKKVKE